MAGAGRDRVLDAQTTAVLDALALVETRLRGDEEGVSVLLDHGDNRASAALLASMLATVIGATADPRATLDGIHMAMIESAADEL